MTEPSPDPINPFRRRLLDGERLIGCWLSLGTPVTTEVMGLAGFDWLLLDAEHAPNDVVTLAPQLMALKDSPSTPFVRPPWNDTVAIKRLLDTGFMNFLIPFVENAEQAKAAVAATRYPPAGVRGVSVSHRGNRYGSIPDYLERINDEIVVAVQIENREGVDSAAEIAAVDGIDALFVGPSDLCASLGHIGRPDHPEVVDAVEAVRVAAAAAGKPSGILAPLEQDARRYLEAGMTFVAVGSDLGLLGRHSKALAARYHR